MISYGQTGKLDVVSCFVWYRHKVPANITEDQPLRTFGFDIKTSQSEYSKLSFAVITI